MNTEEDPKKALGLRLAHVGINGGTGGVVQGQWRGGDLYAFGFDQQNIGANADYRARLRAMLLQEYPTGLTIAA